ncbi:MAG: M16 family metallopeptidase [Paracoccaceae bacterium]
MKTLITTAFAWVMTLGTALAGVQIQEVTSPGGVKAWLVEDHSIPFMALQVSFKGGASLDAPGRRGATYLMMGLLEEGSADLDAIAYTQALEALAASVEYDSTDDYVSISARFLSENRDQFIPLLRDTLMKPRFDQDAVDRVRDQVLSGLANDAKDPDKIASSAFSAMAFGDHPYGSSEKGTIESVSALTRDDMLGAHARVFARDRLVVGAVGDITPEALGEMLDTLFADLPESSVPLPDKADVTIAGGETVIEYATPQSVAVFGQIGIDRHDEDFFAAYVLNQVLGGGSFESRLMSEVREKRGLTYGVYSYLAPRDYASIYLGSVASANDRIAEAIEVIRGEWERAATEGVSAQEVEDAKTYLTGAYPLRFDGNTRIARILVGMQMDDLPIDYIQNRNAKVEAVTLEDVNRVAAELLDPDGLHFVVVGQPQGLDSSTN